MKFQRDKKERNEEVQRKSNRQWRQGSKSSVSAKREENFIFFFLSLSCLVWLCRLPGCLWTKARGDSGFLRKTPKPESYDWDEAAHIARPPAALNRELRKWEKQLWFLSFCSVLTLTALCPPVSLVLPSTSAFCLLEKKQLLLCSLYHNSTQRKMNTLPLFQTRVVFSLHKFNTAFATTCLFCKVMHIYEKENHTGGEKI